MSIGPDGLLYVVQLTRILAELEHTAGYSSNNPEKSVVPFKREDGWDKSPSFTHHQLMEVSKLNNGLVSTRKQMWWQPESNNKLG